MLFPNECRACNTVLVEGEHLICTACKYDLPYTNYQLEKDNPVEKVFWGRLTIEAATSYLHFTKGGKVQSLLHRLKYKNDVNIGVKLGEELGGLMKQSGRFNGIDMILPVPLHKKRKHNRGYNQSAAFALGLSCQLGIPFNDSIIHRNRHTQSQTNKNRHERWENVQGVFSIKHTQLIEGKHLLLVDDVLTTGATLESCANTITIIPGCKVSVATIAYADY